MQFKITHSPGFSKLDVTFKVGDVLFAQPKSMLCMTTGFDLSAHIGGATGTAGVVSGFKSVLSGESFATSVFTAKRDNETLSLAPSNIGEIICIELTGETAFYLTKGAYLAHESTVKLAPRFGGLKGILTKKGLFLLHASGKGKVFIASYGAVIQRTLADKELLVVDNEYVLAFSDTLHYELRAATKSLKDSLMSGEGLVNRYEGPGVFYYQTRSRQRTSRLGSLLNVAT